MRDRGLDSSAWIRFLQNGAAGSKNPPSRTIVKQHRCFSVGLYWFKWCKCSLKYRRIKASSQVLSAHIAINILPQKLHSVLLVLLLCSTFTSSVPFLPKKDLMSLSSYQLRDGMRSPSSSWWPHTIFEKALKLSLGIAVRFSGDRTRRAALMSAKLEREEIWKKWRRNKKHRRGRNEGRKRVREKYDKKWWRSDGLRSWSTSNWSCPVWLK